MYKVRIGTRGSDLAMWQARFLKNELLAKCSLESEIIIIQTLGDKTHDLSFDNIDDMGFFTKALEDALINNEIDVAVHSMNDLPTKSNLDLCIAALSERADCRNTLLINKSAYFPANDLRLKNGAIVGTSSKGHTVQLMHLKPNCIIKDLSGDILTQINKLRTGDYDAIVLAKDGLLRLQLDLSEFETVDFHPAEFTPAPAQGVSAYQCRKDDLELRKSLLALHHDEVSSCTNVERQVLHFLKGDCDMPLGVYCEKDSNGYFHVYASFCQNKGLPLIRVQKSQSTTFELAEVVVQLLLKQNDSTCI